RLPLGRLYVPEEAADGVRELLALHERLANTHFDQTEVLALAEGDVVPILRGREIVVHRSTHRVPRMRTKFARLALSAAEGMKRRCSSTPATRTAGFSSATRRCSSPRC